MQNKYLSFRFVYCLNTFQLENNRVGHLKTNNASVINIQAFVTMYRSNRGIGLP
jgi:hypothetical protein